MQEMIRKPQSGDAVPTAAVRPLDPAQLKRIEAVHRGFLYQHLYAVACLLTCGRRAGNSLVVEHDEDVEFSTAETVTYIQVKTRSKPLQHSDIAGALDRFDNLRAEHTEGRRPGTASFAIVSNANPGPELALAITADTWPADVAVLSPKREQGPTLPPAWPDLESAILWCTKQAEGVPFGTLASETLVWKLAARVQYAASGACAHKFSAADLPVLLEQLLVQLQDFPDAPANYRPQVNEPPLVADQRLRLLVGFSGAGKTAWASQAALHCPAPVAYYDVGDMPAASVANALARELVARFAGGRQHKVGGAILAETAGLDVLRACAAHLRSEGLEVTVVVDNAHRMSADAIKSIVGAAPNLRFLFMAQPWDGQTQLEAQFEIRAERLQGWSRDDIAAEFKNVGCVVTIEDSARVARLTGCLPLYVRGAARLTASNYAGDASAFCGAMESLTHAEATAQEVILEGTFARLSKEAREAAGLLSLSDVALTNAEAATFLQVIAQSPSGAATVLRELRRTSTVIGYQGDRLGLHDALRPLASAVAHKFSPDIQDKALHCLYEIFVRSLSREQNIPRLNTLLRLLPRIGRTDALVDLATHEMFHEQGDPRTLKAELEKAAQDLQATASDRYWAHDALAYWESRDGGRPSAERLSDMNTLVEQGNLGARERLGLLFKELAAAGYDRDRKGVATIYAAAKKLVKDDKLLARLLRYNHAAVLYRIGDYRQIISELETLIAEYYAAIGLKEADVFMKSNAQIDALLPKPLDTDALKRLADALSLWCSARVHLDLPPMLRRIHAAKFYLLSQAARSAAVTAQEAADDFLVILADPIGARETMEKYVLPVVAEYHLTDMIVPVRSHYAIVLAWCGEIAESRNEMKALSAYAGSADQKAMLEERNAMVDAIASGRTWLEKKAPPRNALQMIPGALPKAGHKIGRNEACPCGSGKKFKRCHGA